MSTLSNNLKFDLVINIFIALVSSNPVLNCRSPSRPENLSSYYPGVSTEGSGVGGLDARFINTLGDLSDADLISPTRYILPAYLS